jgi:hypothetical protein
MLVGDKSCVPFFLATVIIGNLVVLNLFLALLLSSFGASSLSAPQADAETNKLAEAFNRIGRFTRWIKSGIRKLFSMIFGLLRCSKKKDALPAKEDQTDNVSIATVSSRANGKKIDPHGNLIIMIITFTYHCSFIMLLFKLFNV